ncbi:hypothetical protein FGO68_gene17556 [Halteria grandinella]|uniref:Uncharacterized protein n=1 Tax=Halteria grandinella TaxID=5974 RepID=A0A8J8T7L0_HALGN|nr:hypothetical protein FGO68_gene17556 [Halteria grandinella]
MQHVIDSQPAVFVLRYLIMKEIMFKIATLNKDSREFVATRLPHVKKDRVMTVRMDYFTLKPRPKGFKTSWIPNCMTQLTLILTNGVDFNYILSILKLFRPSIVLNIELENFTDEDVGAEKFMELLGYYQINEVNLSKASINLKSSANYLIGPAKIIRANNSLIKFQRLDQVLSVEQLRLENCKIHINHNVELLFANVKRCYISNTTIKDTWPQLFSSNLKELVVKKSVCQQANVTRLDVIKKLIQEGGKFRHDLRLLSIHSYTTEDAVMALLSHNHLFPNLEVLRVRYDQLRLSTSKIRVKLRLPHLIKLDLRGCLVKIDDPGTQMIQSRNLARKDMPAMTVEHTAFKKIKKKALGKNYQRVAWQDSPATSDDESAQGYKRNRYAHESCESDNSDELDRTRKKHIAARRKAKLQAMKEGKSVQSSGVNGLIRFNFEKDLLF